MTGLYSKQTISNFRNPHNYGELKNPDGKGEVGNIICGDIMTLYIKVKKDIITDVKFKTYGCAAAIATSSVITDLAIGKTIDEALLLGKKDVVDVLHGLPLSKFIVRYWPLTPSKKPSTSTSHRTNVQCRKI